MSTTAAALTVLAVLLGFSFAALCWQVRRARRAESVRDRIIRESNVRPEPDVRDASETKPGTDVAVQDALELIYSLDAYDPADDPELNARLERLRQAIRDEQNKGD